ncbi:MAG: hypothetical protein ACFFBP_09765 [Promethearchaeota archaeon]
MENKYQDDIQKEINLILERIRSWKNLFFIASEYYFDGWSIILKEKNAYPRRIVIFKSYLTNSYSIKSFEIHFDTNHKEKHEELYFVDKIRTPEEVLREIKEIIYGKDLFKCIKKEMIQKLS